jgi:hypothetical protein
MLFDEKITKFKSLFLIPTRFLPDKTAHNIRHFNPSKCPLSRFVTSRKLKRSVNIEEDAGKQEGRTPLGRHRRRM